ncbi:MULTISPECIES: acyl-CoA dehydrogenase family protein [Nonomuraea]|uniref:Acyl-CoA dehydrogenase family protein n=2 Tax=Nonomuraea TaxID=83681 RepID=A0ABW1BKT2_9ACTN|nr:MULTISPECIES: acyl-CoA dehydrogenase family protein [Nonomuraea]MDA0642925.1 acyl-CoA dehydrogenase family protein [Nonomuraea ferruginea]TXK34379.1 acyl-CoA dehydrogenase [Nonomuraea sp. C10]
MDSGDFAAVLSTVREFVREVVVPAEDVIEETDEIPERIRGAAAGMGLFGYTVPEEYGGLGCDAEQDARLAMELGYTTPSFRSMFGTNNGIAGQVLVNFGTERQKAEFLPRMAAGECVASFALTEPEAGSDPSGLRTRAVRDGDDYVIDGHKRFITNADRSDVLMVFARTGEAGPKGISVFAVDTRTPGVTVGPRDKKMGQRGSHTSEIHFDGVRVPASRLIGEVENEGFAAAMRSLAKGRLHIAACCVGLAQRLVDESVRYAASAKQGGTVIGTFQQVQAMIADSQTELMAGRALVLSAARAYDDGTDRRIGPSSAKLFCSEMAGRVADRAVQIHGGSGYMHGVPVERLYRDARLYRIYEGTSEVQKLIIARNLMREVATR